MGLLRKKTKEEAEAEAKRIEAYRAIIEESAENVQAGITSRKDFREVIKQSDSLPHKGKKYIQYMQNPENEKKIKNLHNKLQSLRAEYIAEFDKLVKEALEAYRNNGNENIQKGDKIEFLYLTQVKKIMDDAGLTEDEKDFYQIYSAAQSPLNKKSIQSDGYEK